MAMTRNQDEAGRSPNVREKTNTEMGGANPHENREHDHQQTTAEKITEKVVKAANAEDEPMGRQNPEAPFALVGLSYLAALALVILIVVWVAFMIVN